MIFESLESRQMLTGITLSIPKPPVVPAVTLPKLPTPIVQPAQTTVQTVLGIRVSDPLFKAKIDLIANAELVGATDKAKDEALKLLDAGNLSQAQRVLVVDGLHLPQEALATKLTAKELTNFVAGLATVGEDVRAHDPSTFTDVANRGTDAVLGDAVRASLGLPGVGTAGLNVKQLLDGAAALQGFGADQTSASAWQGLGQLQAGKITADQFMQQFGNSGNGSAGTTGSTNSPGRVSGTVDAKDSTGGSSQSGGSDGSNNGFDRGGFADFGDDFGSNRNGGSSDNSASSSSGSTSNGTAQNSGSNNSSNNSGSSSNTNTNTNSTDTSSQEPAPAPAPSNSGSNDSSSSDNNNSSNNASSNNTGTNSSGSGSNSDSSSSSSTSEDHGGRRYTGSDREDNGNGTVTVVSYFDDGSWDARTYDKNGKEVDHQTSGGGSVDSSGDDMSAEYHSSDDSARYPRQDDEAHAPPADRNAVLSQLFSSHPLIKPGGAQPESPSGGGDDSGYSGGSGPIVNLKTRLLGGDTFGTEARIVANKPTTISVPPSQGAQPESPSGGADDTTGYTPGANSGPIPKGPSVA